MFSDAVDAAAQRHRPRTDSASMDFMTEEFIRGALAAWFWFLGISTLALAPVLTLMVLVVPIYSVPWSLGALLVGSPIAYAIAKGLRNVSSVAVHMIAFGLFGAAVGIATMWAATWAAGPLSLEECLATFLSLPYLVMVAAASISVLLGWRRGARRILLRKRAAW